MIYNTPQQFKAVLFDLDGTLADCFRDIQAATNHAMRHVGLPEHSLEVITSFVGKGIDHLMRCACGPNASEEEAQEALAVGSQYYAEHPAEFAELYPGTRELLTTLKQAGIKIAVVSNKPHVLAVPVCDQLGLSGLIDVIVGESARQPKKPDPAMLLDACRQLGIDASEAVMVGDGVMDIQAARSAGVTSIAVTWGMTPEDRLTSEQPELVVHNAKMLEEFLLDNVFEKTL
jgi:phosphoglycolate phosphatase